MDWDERYRKTSGYLFGTVPSRFIVEQAARLRPNSTVLCLADGEGRNSVYLAGLGHRVTAIDNSPLAIERARRLAVMEDVSVDFLLADMEHESWANVTYHAVVGVFMQVAPQDIRRKLHWAICRAVRPGGLVMLHGYAKRQPQFGTGGSRDPGHLYDHAELIADFPDWTIEFSADYDAELSEGIAHVGMSALIDFIARKPIRVAQAVEMAGK